MILFAYDGPEDARRALSARVDLGRRRALVVHVWEPVPPGAATAVATPGAVGAALPKLAEVEHEIERQARDLLKEGVELAEAAGFEAEPVLVEGSLEASGNACSKLRMGAMPTSLSLAAAVCRGCAASCSEACQLA